MKVVGADGASWDVSRRVLPRKPNLRRAIELDPSGVASDVVFVLMILFGGDRVNAIADRIRAVAGRGSISKSRYDMT